jgi:hypothetical protein
MCSNSWMHFVTTSLRDYLETGAGSPNGSSAFRVRRAGEGREAG